MGKEEQMSNKLAYILEDQLSEARRTGRTAVRRLYNGLRIAMDVNTSQVELALTRDGQYPSLNEWETVLRYLPFTAEKINPQATKEGERYQLKATFLWSRTFEQVKLL